MIEYSFHLLDNLFIITTKPMTCISVVVLAYDCYTLGLRLSVSGHELPAPASEGSWGCLSAVTYSMRRQERGWGCLSTVTYSMRRQERGIVIYVIYTSLVT